MYKSTRNIDTANDLIIISNNITKIIRLMFLANYKPYLALFLRQLCKAISAMFYSESIKKLTEEIK